MVTISNNVGTLIGVAIYLLIFLGGLRAFILGFRGRKIDNHPLCAMCRFDLTGLPDDQQACPECGTRLSPKTIVQGNRQRQKKRMLIGAVMMLVVIGLCVPNAIRIAGQVHWLSKAPTWYLRSQVNNDTSLAKESWDILSDRLNIGKLSYAQKQALTQDVMKLQSDITRKWYVDAGDVVEKMHATGILSQQQWDTYRQTIIDQLYVMTIRNDIEHGEWIVVSLSKNPSRMGRAELWCAKRELKFMLGDLHLYTRELGETSIATHSGGSTSFTLHIKKKQWEKIAVGKQTITARMQCQLYDPALRPLPREHDGLDILERELKFEQDVQFVPKGTSTVTPIVDESLRQQMVQSITVKLTYKPEKYADWDVELDFNMLPKPIAFDVSIRFQDQTQRMSSVHVPANKQSGWWIGGRHRINIKDGDTVDVLLTPNVEVAEKTTYLTEFWDGAITIKDVPVTVK